MYIWKYIFFFISEGFSILDDTNIEREKNKGVNPKLFLALKILEYVIYSSMFVVTSKVIIMLRL